MFTHPNCLSLHHDSIEQQRMSVFRILLLSLFLSMSRLADAITEWHGQRKQCPLRFLDASACPDNRV